MSLRRLKILVKKCKGLPLVAKALGSLMHNKRTKREWLGIEQKVFQPLLLSYYYLAPLVKYYKFKRKYLINLWMTQDDLNSKGNKDNGEIGEAFFDKLVARSVFQDLKKDSVSDKIIGCKMHDVVHNFVQSLTKNEYLIIERLRVRLLTLRLKLYEPLLPSKAYYNCKNLHTVTTLNSSIDTINSNFILQLKCLRTINLNGNFIRGIPKKIGKLAHLRHLDLSRSYHLRICELYILYTLRLYKFAKRIRRLKNLKTIHECVVVCGEDEDRAVLQLGDLFHLLIFLLHNNVDRTVW
ncbi:disease resistance protein RGA3 [Pyrus ussuriensis x Pyrus communis]|uniref:Disease resistance protein RGA3 n=1 Tax=Pyrus ussuriensis x Pyrus communis TaxID=2448454 RepID=A0A5N5GVL8_9ROSA|nr:disease resistance protein RGA3 [Pyrus ussuriensis x Pyrus communis]